LFIVCFIERKSWECCVAVIQCPTVFVLFLNRTTHQERHNSLITDQTISLANTVVLCISADLPFAQARFCGAEGLSNVINLSTMRGQNFLKDYGVAIANGPLTGVAARAVIVLDEHDKVLHSELVAEIGDEPNYAAATAVLK